MTMTVTFPNDTVEEQHIKPNRIKVQKIQKTADGREIKVMVEQDIKEVEESLKSKHNTYHTV